tara:strand:+ start:191159 stop:191317 length:159 start_codon:yes stop_codon:yes gene_type:complete
MGREEFYRDQDIEIVSEEEFIRLLFEDEEFAARFMENIEEVLRRITEEDIVD